MYHTLHGFVLHWVDVLKAWRRKVPIFVHLFLFWSVWRIAEKRNKKENMKKVPTQLLKAASHFKVEEETHISHLCFLWSLEPLLRRSRLRLRLPRLRLLLSLLQLRRFFLWSGELLRLLFLQLSFSLSVGPILRRILLNTTVYIKLYHSFNADAAWSVLGGCSCSDCCDILVCKYSISQFPLAIWQSMTDIFYFIIHQDLKKHVSYTKD